MHHHTASASWLPLAALALGVAYEMLVACSRRTWPWWRTASFLTGCAVLTAGLLPAGGFAGHMWQHLLIGMVAPIALAFGAPVTLLLRALPGRPARVVGRALHRRPLRVVAHPATALTLNLGGLALLYFTPLYAVTAANATAHHLVQLHFLLAGYLFAWAVAGPDPAPRRPSVPARLVLLP